MVFTIRRSMIVGTTRQRPGVTYGRCERIDEYIPQHPIAELGLRRADAISFTEVVYADCCCHTMYQVSSFRCQVCYTRDLVVSERLNPPVRALVLRACS